MGYGFAVFITPIIQLLINSKMFYEYVYTNEEISQQIELIDQKNNLNLADDNC